MRRGRLVCGLAVLALAGCVNAPPPKGNYSQFRTENPHSILVVPVTNKSVDVNAPDYFSRPSRRPWPSGVTTCSP